MYNLDNFNEFRDLCHSTSDACGWWRKAERYYKDPMTGDVLPGFDPDRLNIPTKLALVHTEIREARDYYLSGEDDDHLPHLPGAPVELGDVIIRVGDTAGYLEINMNAAIATVHPEFALNVQGFIIWNGPDAAETERWRGSEAVMQLHNFTADAMEAFRRSKMDEFALSLARVVVLAALICERNEWDLFAISVEKVEYNKVRADHKADARAGAGGKIV